MILTIGYSLWKNEKYKLKWRFPQQSELIAAGNFTLLTVASLFLIFFYVIQNLDWLPAMLSNIQHKLDEFGVNSLNKYLCFVLFISVINSLLEELYWRWIIFRGLDITGWHWLGSALFVAFCFAIHHFIVLLKYLEFTNISWVLFFSLCTSLGSMVWSWMMRRSGFIWSAWLSHLCIDIAFLALTGWLLWENNLL